MARILIADDDADIRRLIVVALVNEGHEVSAAGDGRSARAALSEAMPDLVLLDVMPDRDGFEVLEQLNVSGLREQTRVLMLTTRGSERDASRAFELGADAYMTKPFELDELVSRVNQLLAMTGEELKSGREMELDRSRLLSQLESILGDG